MSKLPPIQTRAMPTAQQNWLQRWLALWEDDRLLQSLEPAAPPAAGGPAQDPLVQPYHQPPLQLGEIRLLAPHVTPASADPVFVAVYSEWNPVGYMIAPFSRFPVPAFTGELFTGWKEAQLRVLNVWNSFSMAPDALTASWLVDRLSEEECARARALFRHTIFGHELAGDLSALIGPPITHPLDPRLIYQRQEVQRLATLSALQNTGAADDEKDMEEFLQYAWRTAHGAAPPSAASKPAGTLIPYEQVLSAQLAEETEQLAAAGKVSDNQVIICKGAYAQAKMRLVYSATADGGLLLEQNQTLVPDVLWTLRAVPSAVAAQLANARVLFMQGRTSVFVAEGHVDETGTIILMDALKPDPKARYPVKGADLVLFILPGLSA
jgi:hypothetical protein